MKIGIITFWNSQDNYGQLLQCFALQHYLRKKGHQPFLIRYVPQAKKKTTLDRILGLWKLLSPQHVMAYASMLKNHKKSAAFDALHPRYFDQFREEHLVSSSSIYYSLGELQNENWDADALICGSDQIWSYSHVQENIKAMFLEFAVQHTRKIAYAASFGRAELPADYAAMLPQLLSNFKSVSLREVSGVELCQKAGRKDASLVCDPTILLEGKDYIETIVKEKIVPEDSVFTYFINWETEFPLEEIRKFISDENLKMNFNGAHGIENKNMFPFMTDLTIASWLRKMGSSRYVFTNSFHGTVFAILLKRPFIAFPLIGVSSSMNGRITTLLSRLGLEKQIYSPAYSIHETLNNPIDWSDVDHRINAFKLESESFLESALK